MQRAHKLHYSIQYNNITYDALHTVHQQSGRTDNKFVIHLYTYNKHWKSWAHDVDTILTCNTNLLVFVLFTEVRNEQWWKQNIILEMCGMTAIIFYPNFKALCGQLKRNTGHASFISRYCAYSKMNYTEPKIIILQATNNFILQQFNNIMLNGYRLP